jgi:hypothetical protein
VLLYQKVNSQSVEATLAFLTLYDSDVLHSTFTNITLCKCSNHYYSYQCKCTERTYVIKTLSIRGRVTDVNVKGKKKVINGNWFTLFVTNSTARTNCDAEYTVVKWRGVK